MEETLEDMQARHRKEQRDLQGRITNKKKNATKKTRKGVADECVALERAQKEKHEAELAVLRGEDTQGKDDEEVKDVAGALADASLADSKPDMLPSETAATTPDEAGEGSSAMGGGAGGTKKRNRQKERLARRAADAEAASAAAEAEAANMTDHAAAERAAMQPVFEAHGRAEHEIRPDGHCLFAAVADQLARQDIALGGGSGGGGTEEMPPYKAVRHTAAAYMADHADDFAPFLDEDLDAHVAKMRDTAEWGGHTELMALARAYGVGIHIVQKGRTDVIPPGEGVEEKGAVWLAYYRHGYALGEHYNSLRKKEA